jgi:hypothetical protein
MRWSRLSPKNKGVSSLLNELNVRLKELKELQLHQEVCTWLDDVNSVETWAKEVKGVVWNVGYGAYKAFNTTATVAQFVKFAAILSEEFKLVTAVNVAAPGISIMKTTLSVAGTTSAKILQGTLAGIGIAVGI